MNFFSRPKKKNNKYIKVKKRVLGVLQMKSLKQNEFITMNGSKDISSIS